MRGAPLEPRLDRLGDDRDKLPVTVAQLRQNARLAQLDPDDPEAAAEEAYLLGCIASATADAQNRTRRSIAPERWRLALSGAWWRWGEFVPTPRGNLLSVERVQFGGVEVAGWRMQGGNSQPGVWLPASPSPANVAGRLPAEGELMIEFTAGWPPDAVPADLARFILLRATDLTEARSTLLPGSGASASLPVDFTEFMVQPHALPIHWKALYREHRCY